MISKTVLVVGSTDGLVGLVLRIVRGKSYVEMAAYSSLACAMASLRVPLFDAMFVITCIGRLLPLSALLA